MEAFKNELVMMEFKQGETVFDVGEPSDYFYILMKGKLRADTAFKVEAITKWPINMSENEWSFLTKNVLRTTFNKVAPDIFGHPDVLSGKRPRILRTTAITDIIVLRGAARLLYEYLDAPMMKAITASVSSVNQYEIGSAYLDAKLSREAHLSFF